MRILVDIPKSELELIDEVAGERAVSRAEIIREAIANSLTPYRRRMKHDAFGLWARFGEDGLAHQRRMRADW